MKHLLLVATALMSVAGPASAAVIFDQLAVTPDGNSSQRFEPAFATFDSTVIDDFTVSSSTNLTSVTAFFIGNVGSATAFGVEIYSSKAAALASLAGDVASLSFAPGAASISGGNVTIALSTTIGAGTYWLSVIPTLNFTSFGQSYLGWGGTGNAFFVNPGGGFAQPAGTELGANATLRLEGTPLSVPEPASWAMLLGGFGLTGLALRRRRETVVSA
jgi:hypothetical protein